MAIDNLNNENVPLAPTSLPQGSEEHGFDLLNNDFAKLSGVSGDTQHTDMPMHPLCLPVLSMSPPHWNVPGISQDHSREIGPNVGNSLIYSSQINSSKNFLTCHHYLGKEDLNKSLLHQPDSDFQHLSGYEGQPYQNNNQDYLTMPDKMMNSSFNLNSSEKLDSGRKVAYNCSSDGGSLVLKPSSKEMNVNIGLPPPNLNFGTPPFSSNQGGVPLNFPGKHYENYTTFGSESNDETAFDSNISGINITGNSRREYNNTLINDHHTQMGSRSFINPGFDMNNALPGFENNNAVVSDLPLNMGAWMHSTDDHKVVFDARPSVGLGASNDFRRPAAGDQIQYVRPVKMDLGLGNGKDEGMEISDLSQKKVIGQSKASEQVVFSSPGMISNQSSSRQVSSDGKFSSQFSTPLEVATGRTSWQDPSSNLGQSQVVGSMQQPNAPLGSFFTSDFGMQTGIGNMTSQVSGPYIRSSIKRGASEPQSSTLQVPRTKSLRTHPFIHPSVQPWTLSPPLVPNTSQTLPPLFHRATSLMPQMAHSIVHPSIQTKSPLSAPNISQTIPPIIRPVPSLPPQAYATVPLSLQDRRGPSFLSPTQIIPVRHQPQMAQRLPHPRLRHPITSSAPKIAPVHVKNKDAGQTKELIGHKCLLCKRDLSFTPEGPISQPSPPPAAAVLPCGHTFHDDCLQRITPEDQSKDPPCIPCALSG